MRLSFLILLLLLVAIAGPRIAGAQAPAGGTPAQSPQQQLLAQLKALADKEPGHVGVLYTAAKVAAGIRDQAQAIAWLDRLEQVGLGDELDPDDFSAIAEAPAYRERAARFSRAAPPLGMASLWAETRCRDLLPEGTAWDAKRNELLISSGRQRNVFAIKPDGTCRAVVPAPEGKLLAVLGMAVDAASDSLWVASSAAPFMRDPQPGEAGTARLTQLDLASGRVLASHSLGGGVLLNDLAIAADGSIYVTESRAGRVYRLRPGGAELEAIVSPDTFEGPNGIVALANGDLLVADFHGLSRIASPATPRPAVHRLATPNGVYLGGFDGLARAGDNVIGVHNLVGRARIWSLTLDANAASVSEARVLLRGHADFRNPTTGAIAGDRFLFVADPNVQAALPAGGVTPLPEGRTGHRILALPLRGQSQH